MNYSELSGLYQLMSGYLLARLAGFCGNQFLSDYSVKLQTAGKTQIAIGQARTIIRHSVKRNGVSA